MTRINHAERTIAKYLEASTQRLLVEQVRQVAAASPMKRPKTPTGIAMRVRVTSAGQLGWADGYRYSDRDPAGHAWPPMPSLWHAIADDVAGPHPWDSAIVNWYEPDAALGWHRDQSEHDTTLPIVTISLGDSCSWAVREDERSSVSRVRLDSGAVTLLAGPYRPWLHTVEAIIANPMFSPLDRRGRISITIRVAGEVQR